MRTPFSHEAAMLTLALVLLLVVNGCTERGHVAPFVGNDLDAARECHHRGYGYMRLNADGSLSCFIDPQMDTLDVEQTLAEADAPGVVR